MILRDLRYGIDTAGIDEEAEIERKILTECFEVINACDLFVLLLGSRYGSVMDDISVANHYIPEKDVETMSVTHMEVEYGKAQIGKERIVAFCREYQGEISTLPLLYRGEDAKAQQLEQLRRELSEEDIKVLSYGATMEEDVFVIDEMCFMKYTQALIGELVTNYIRYLEENNLQPKEAEDAETYHEEVLNDELYGEIEKKLQCQPEELKGIVRDMLMFRIQNLLCKEDYEKIHQLGGDGKAILQYRKQLVQSASEDLVELIKEVCRAGVRSIEEATDLYPVLQYLACIKQSRMFPKGEASIYDLENLLNKQLFPKDKTYDFWQDVRLENKEFRSYQSPLDRALANFLGKNSLLVYGENGYALANDVLAEKLYEDCPVEMLHQVREYAMSMFWYLPNPAEVWITCLKAKEYELCIAGLEFVGRDNRFDDVLLEYVHEKQMEEELFAALEQFANWIIRTHCDESYIMYCVSISGALMLREDEDLEEELFQKYVYPLCGRLYEKYVDEHRNDMTLSEQYFAHQLYLEFAADLKEQPLHCLRKEQIEAVECIGEAFYELIETPEWTAGEVTEDWAQILRMLRMECVREGYSYITNSRLFHLAQMFCNNFFRQDLLPDMLRVMLQTKHNGNDLVETVGIVCEQVLGPLLAHKQYALCSECLQILYEFIVKEEQLRKHIWLKWLDWLYYDMLEELYSATKDKLAGTLLDWMNECMGVDLDEAF